MQCPPYNTYGPLFTYNILLLSLMQDLMLLLATLAALHRQYFAQSQAVHFGGVSARIRRPRFSFVTTFFQGLFHFTTISVY